MHRYAPLLALGRALRDADYRFVAVTPETHRRVNARVNAGPDPSSPTLRDIFGWSRPFERSALRSDWVDLLERAGALLPAGDKVRSAVRFATLGPNLFVHSAYPTVEPHSVFFGPDTYRFCAAIARLDARAARVVDIGCGSGVGGIVAGRDSQRIVLADINEEALVHARVNAELAGARGVEVVRSDVFASIEGVFDLIVCNPPYLVDEQQRVYRDGGGAHGEALAARIADESLARLAPGGTLLLYTGAAIVDGDDMFLRAVTPRLERAGISFRYEEVDPDVFGDELDRPSYAAVERIAAVVLTATRDA